MINKFKNFIIISFFFIGIYFIIKQNSHFDFISIIILISLYSLTSITLLFYYYRINFTINLPIFALTNLYFFICYISLFLFNKYLIFSYTYNVNEFAHALKVLFYGYVAFMFGYLILIWILKNFQRKSLKIFDVSNNEIFILGIFLSSCDILFYYIINIQNYLPFLAQIKYTILLFANGLLILFITTNKKEKNFYIKNFLCIFLILIPIISELIAGYYSFPFLLIFLNFAFYSHIKKKIIITPFILIVIIFIFVHMGKYPYRGLTWSGEYKGANQLVKLSVFFNSYKNMITDGNYNLGRILAGKPREIKCSHGRFVFNCPWIDDLNLKRMFHSFESLLIVTKNTPEIIPYLNGDSYIILKSKLIPRIFWKNKPSDIYGNEFGHRYNILNKYDAKLGTKKDTVTSWNMPVLNEFYVNYGAAGVIYGMLLIGILFGFIVKIGSLQNIKNLESIIVFFIFVPVFFLESHLSMIFGALIQSYIFLMLISFIFLKVIRKLHLA